MPYNLKGRNYTKLLDFSPREIRYLLDLARDLKRAKYAGTEQKNLEGKNIALIFEKTSTRTRCSFEVAAHDQGAHITYIGGGSQMGIKESTKDTARVLGKFFDGIEYRGRHQKDVEILAEYAGVPVWNGLTDEFHPTQLIADFMTIEEHFGYLKGIKIAFSGDGRNNMGASIMVASAKMGLDCRIVSPKELSPAADLVKQCQDIAKENGGKITVTDNVAEGVKDANVVYADVWVSMGEPEELWAERIKLLKPYQINKDLISKCADNVVLLHCLPAFHDTNTTVGKMIYEKFGITEMEVSDDVFESKRSLAFEEAENRMHSIKAIMVATLGK